MSLGKENPSYVACEQALCLGPFPLLAIFSPFRQMESLFTGYQLRYIFSKFNPLNTGFPLIRTLCMAPSVFVLTGFDCISLSRVTDRRKGCKTVTSTSMKGFRKQLPATVTTGAVASLYVTIQTTGSQGSSETEAAHIHNT